MVLFSLIVVIAIIGVLAAILVPSMMGYVKNSRLKSANANAKVVFNAVNSYATQMQIEGRSVDDIYIIVNPIDCSVGGSGGSGTEELKQAICDALKNNGSASGWAYLGFNDSKDEFKWAQWAKSTTDKVVGQYPDPPEDYDSCPTFGTYKAVGSGN